MLITKEVQIPLNNTNIAYYRDKGLHQLTNKEIHEKHIVIMVPVEHLPKGAGARVDCECDNCGKLLKNLQWNNYTKTVKDDGKTYCNHCCKSLYSSENMRLTKLNKGISLHECCLENNYIDLLNRWDYIKNIHSPKEVGYGANEKQYLLCPLGIHESEEKNIKGFIVTKQLGSLDCFACNSLGFNYPESFDFWSDQNMKSPNDYSWGNPEKVYWTCPEKKHGDYKRAIVATLYANFHCPECIKERRESFLQEKVRLYLEEICDKYKWKLNHERNCSIVCQNPNVKNKTGEMRYDNEVVGQNFNLIVESHGQQHFDISIFHCKRAKKNNTTPQDELNYDKWKDEYKMNYALDNGYFYLAIPYTADDKNETYKIMIDDMLNFIHENI